MVPHCDSASNMWWYASYHTAYLCERLLAKVRLTLQNYNTYYSLLPVWSYIGMELWNEIWNKILVWSETWNGKFLIWNGNGTKKTASMEYGKIVFHSIPCTGCGKSTHCTIRMTSIQELHGKLCQMAAWINGREGPVALSQRFSLWRQILLTLGVLHVNLSRANKLLLLRELHRASISYFRCFVASRSDQSPASIKNAISASYQSYRQQS